MVEPMRTTVPASSAGSRRYCRFHALPGQPFERAAKLRLLWIQQVVGRGNIGPYDPLPLVQPLVESLLHLRKSVRRGPQPRRENCAASCWRPSGSKLRDHALVCSPAAPRDCSAAGPGREIRASTPENQPAPCEPARRRSAVWPRRPARPRIGRPVSSRRASLDFADK